MKLICSIFNRFMKDERGAVIILVAFLLVFVLIGMAALSVDVGYLYLQKRHLQTTVDAAALAAAWELPFENPQIEIDAQEYALYNNIDYSHSDTVIDVSDAYGDNNAVRVEITKNYPLFFALAPPIGQTDSDVYATAVAIREYTFIDLLPFLLLEYDEIIDDANIDPDDWEIEWDNWETDRDAFYLFMQSLLPLTINLWVNSSSGNWGVADMRDFVNGMDTSGNINQQEVQYILKHGLDENFCLGEGKIRSGRAGVASAIETSNPGADGMRISERLGTGDDFFMPMILPGLAENFQGSHSSFGLEDFLIGHITEVSMSGVGANRVITGTLENVYYCPDIPDEYKKWIPVLIE